MESNKRQEACHELFRVLKDDGVVCLVDIMFPSSRSMELASVELDGWWDDSEDYVLVPELDEKLYNAGFKVIQWEQTARCHWVVFAQ